MRKIVFSTFILIVMALSVAYPAQAATWPPSPESMPDMAITFVGCSNTNPSNTEMGVDQFYVEVYPYPTDSHSATQALFVFYNHGPQAVEIDQVYFDDGALFDLTEVFNTLPQVAFTRSAGEPSLSSPNCIAPPFGALEGAVASQGPVSNGIGPGERLGVLAAISAGHTYSDVLSGLDNGYVRIGVRAVAGSGGSETFVSRNTTALTLESFAARGARSGAILTWVTGAEVDLAGFNLYRAVSPSAPASKVNPTLLAARGSITSGSTYTFRDSVAPGVYVYWLEEISLAGKATRHGPVKVTVGPQFRRPLYRPVLPS